MQELQISMKFILQIAFRSQCSPSYKEIRNKTVTLILFYFLCFLKASAWCLKGKLLISWHHDLSFQIKMSLFLVKTPTMFCKWVIINTTIKFNFVPITNAGRIFFFLLCIQLVNQIDEFICQFLFKIFLTSVQNLGVIFYNNMSFSPHISHNSRSVWYQLHNRIFIRKSLTNKATAQLIHALIFSCLDFFGNSILFGLPLQQVHRLQSLQNSAAQFVMLTRKTTHITPILKSLHWLLVQKRINLKM